MKECLIKFPRGELNKVSISSSDVKVYYSERCIRVQSKHKVSIMSGREGDAMRDLGTPGRRAVGIRLKGQSSRTGSHGYPKDTHGSLELTPFGRQRGGGTESRKYGGRH